MKAIVLESPGEYRLREIEKPSCPDEGILVKVEYCGLCGSDLRTLRSGHRHVKLPAVIGHEVSGHVVETGKLYRGPYAVGDTLAIAPNVYCGECEFCRMGKLEFCENIRELAQQWAGGFAEYMAIPPEALRLGTIQRVPEGMPLQYAAIGEPPSSCINAQEKLDVRMGDTVLIIGTGPIGSIHICVAKARGAKKIIVADVLQSRLDICRAFEPDHLVNASEVDLVEEVRRLTGGKGADVVITANPVAATQVQAIQVAKKGGRIAFFGGLPHGGSDVTIDTNLIHYKALTVIGTTGFAPKHHILSLDLISAGKIPGEKLVTHILPIEEFHQGVQLAVEGKAMKVVFSF